MFIFWLLTETDPDSDFGSAYGSVIDYLRVERAKDPKRFIYTNTEYISPENFFELDLFEIWFATVDDAILFKLAWPFTHTPLLDKKPKSKGVVFQ